MGGPPPYTAEDFDHSPLLVFYEVTRACDLVCTHCRACAATRPHRDELDHDASLALIDQLAEFPKPPLLVLTGGDPFKRADLADLVAHAAARGLRPSVSPSATPLVTREALRTLHERGMTRIAVSVDGADAATHDAIRGVPGTFDRALDIIRDAVGLGIGVQVNTTITRQNVHQVNRMAKVLAELGATMWSVFFLVPVGRGQKLERIEPGQYEEVFERLLFHAARQPYAIKTTEAPFYRRYVLTHGAHPLTPPRAAVNHRPAAGPPAAVPAGPSPFRGPLGVNDGKGVMFVGHTGKVYPSGFLPITAGQFPRDHLVTLYQRGAIFRDLRNPQCLEGKCGRCEFRSVCGGSRARAFGLTGNPFAEEPDCTYQPRAAARRDATEPHPCSA